VRWPSPEVAKDIIVSLSCQFFMHRRKVYQDHVELFVMVLFAKFLADSFCHAFVMVTPKISSKCCHQICLQKPGSGHLWFAEFRTIEDFLQKFRRTSKKGSRNLEGSLEELQRNIG
jgi:hypothetical protein